ncbi:MAG: hypothetical protein U0169_01890 [Polyangiaceae bacterium]
MTTTTTAIRARLRRLAVTAGVTLVFVILHGFAGATLARRDPVAFVLLGHGAELVATLVPFFALRAVLYLVMPVVLANQILGLVATALVRERSPADSTDGPTVERQPSDSMS